MKKWMILALAALLVLTMAGCADKPAAKPEEPVTEPFSEAEFLRLRYCAHTEEDSDDWIFLSWDPEYLCGEWYGGRMIRSG